jgi:hypothetical protein
VKEMNKKTVCAVCACAYALAFGVYNIVFVLLIFFFLFFFFCFCFSLYLIYFYYTDLFPIFPRFLPDLERITWKEKQPILFRITTGLHRFAVFVFFFFFLVFFSS